MKPHEKELALYYDLIYYWLDYEGGAGKVKSLVKEYKKSSGNELLEVACGTGKYIEYLKDEFYCTGVDISKYMLMIARFRYPDITFKQVDMVDLNLKKKFDVIICLFSSIGYVRTYTNLKRTINNFAQHLKKGGVIIIEPWFTKSTFKAGSPHMLTYNHQDIKIARLVVSKQKKNLSLIDMHYLVAERDKDVKYIVEKHKLGLFDIDTTIKILKENGLRSEYFKDGITEKQKGLFVGVRI